MDRFTALYRAHINFVWRVLWRARMPRADVADLAHDVFGVVLRKLRDQHHPPLKTEDEERSWLYKITDNELKNYRTRARFRRVASMDDSPNEIPDPRNDHARLEDRETVHLLLDSIKIEGGRAVFELVEMEGFTVRQAAATLKISVPNAHRRLRLAREDVEATAAKLRREVDAGKRKRSALLMAFGTVPLVQLHGLHDPPAGTVEEIWERLQGTVAKLDRENDGSAPPPRARPLKNLAGLLKSPWFNLVSACLRGAVVALLFLLRPNTKLVPFPLSVPVFVVTSSTSSPAPLPGPISPPVTPTTEVTVSVDEALDEEADLIRQARAAFAKNNHKKMLEALATYERRFPTGRFRNFVRSMRASLPDAGAR